MSGYVNPIPEGLEPVEVIVRHPDFEDDVYLYGLDHRVIVLDLGSSFDASKIGPEDREQIEEWIAGVRAGLSDLPPRHPAWEAIGRVFETLLEDVGARS